MKRTFLLKTMLLLCALIAGSSSVWGEDVTYSMTPDATTTGSSATSYITTLTEFTYNNIKWKMNQWNPSTLQIKTNQASAASEFRFYNTSSFPGRIKQVVITFSALTVSDASKLMFKGGSSEVSGTSGGTAGTWNSTAKTLTWTPASTDNFTYFAFYQDGKAASETNYLASSNAIVVTYETSSDPAINAENVEIAYNATSGEIPFTISNAVENTHLTASITAGDEWLSDADVDETNGKVTFSLTENTAAKREGTIRLVYGNNLATKDIKVTQAGLYSVTYTTTQTGGTLVVKNGDENVASGTKFPVGTVLNIVATPNENYAFKNWQYKKGTGSWVSNTTATTYTIDDNNVEFRANFDATYPVNFYVNGQVASTARFAEDKAITFPESVTSYGGFEFVGWSTSAIDGSVTEEPTLVNTSTEIMGTVEKSYYAVYLKNKYVATFNAADITATPAVTNEDLTWKHTATDITLKLSAGQRYVSATPYTFTVTKGTSNYFQISAPSGYKLKKLIVTLSGSNYKINSVESGASVSTSSTTQTVTFNSDMNSVKCYATSGNQIRVTNIVVEAIEAVNYSTTLTQLVSVTAAEYATYCNAMSALDFSETGITAYTATDNETSVTLNEITTGKVPANTPVVLYKAGGGSVNVPVIASADAISGTNDLHVANGGAVTNAYVLANKSNGVGFYPWGGTTLSAGKIYLQAKDSYESAPCFLPIGETTGIEDAVKSVEIRDKSYYNLNGQRVSQPTKGLYIVNGKKVIMK